MCPVFKLHFARNYGWRERAIRCVFVHVLVGSCINVRKYWFTLLFVHVMMTP